MDCTLGMWLVVEYCLTGQRSCSECGSPERHGVAELLQRRGRKWEEGGIGGRHNSLNKQ